MAAAAACLHHQLAPLQRIEEAAPPQAACQSSVYCSVVWTSQSAYCTAFSVCREHRSELLLLQGQVHLGSLLGEAGPLVHGQQDALCLDAHRHRLALCRCVNRLGISRSRSRLHMVELLFQLGYAAADGEETFGQVRDTICPQAAVSHLEERCALPVRGQFGRGTSRSAIVILLRPLPNHFVEPSFDV